MKSRFAAWDMDTAEAIPALAQEPKPITHGDIGKADIKALCGKQPDGIDWFTPVFPGEPLPADVDCPDCRRIFQQKTTSEVNVPLSPWERG